MLANFEKRIQNGKESVWTGRYRNLQNLPHWHLECELIYIEHGPVTISHNDQLYQLNTGNTIFLNSGEIHYIKSERNSIVTILMFDPQLIQELSVKFSPDSALLEHHYPILECVHQIQEELAAQKPFYELQIRQLLLTLMIQIFRGENCSAPKQPTWHSSIEKYKKLLSNIDQTYHYITFSDAADWMGFSESYFSKFFRKMSGMTFSQYLNIVKLEKAIALLHKNDAHLSMTEIASRCGFDTIRHFNRTFKELTGMSPRELPPDYTLNTMPFRTIGDNFDPTLNTSELL